MLNKKTIDVVGTKTVDLLNSAHDKNRFSVVITVNANGEILPAAVILRGLKKVPNCAIPDNIRVYFNESGTMDSTIMMV